MSDNTTPPAEPVPVVASEPVYAVFKDGKRIAISSLEENAKHAARGEPGSVVMTCYLTATPQAEPAVAEQARDEGYTPADFACWILDHHKHEFSNDENVCSWLAEYNAACAALASQSTPPPESAAPVAVEAGREPTDAQIIEIAETMGKRVPGVSDYEVWGANYYRADSEGNYTIPSVPRLAVPFARRVLSLAAILAANPTAQPDGGSKA